MLKRSVRVLCIHVTCYYKLGTGSIQMLVNTNFAAHYNRVVHSVLGLALDMLGRV